MLCRTISLAITLLAVSPAGVKACICVGRPPPLEREAVFIGTAVELVQYESIPTVGTRRTVRFVVHASWRGPRQDTVTVSSMITGDCGAQFLVGLTYLVAGNYDGEVASTGACDQALGTAAAADFPDASWMAPPIGTRSFDPTVIEVGQPAPEGEPIYLYFHRPYFGVGVRAQDLSEYRLELADITANIEPTGDVWMRVPRGRYRLRVTPPDRSSFEIDLWVACDLPRHCGANRWIPNSSWSPRGLP